MSILNLPHDILLIIFEFIPRDIQRISLNGVCRFFHNFVCHYLKELKVSNFEVSDENFESLISSYRQIETLSINYCSNLKLSNNDFISSSSKNSSRNSPNSKKQQQETSLLNLKNLYAIGCSCDLEIFLLHCPNLEFLDISERNAIKFKNNSFQSLKTLVMADGKCIGSLYEDILKPCISLQNLDLSMTSSLGKFPIELCHPNLEVLCLESCQCITEVVVVYCINHCPRLKNLNLSRCYGIKSLTRFPSNDNLKILDLSYLKKIHSVEAVLKNSHGLTELNIINCQFLTSWNQIGPSQQLQSLLTTFNDLTAREFSSLQNSWYPNIRIYKNIKPMHKCVM